MDPRLFSLDAQFAALQDGDGAAEEIDAIVGGLSPAGRFSELGPELDEERL